MIEEKTVEERLRDLRKMLRSRRRLLADGLTEAQLRGSVARGEILRMLQGRYVFASDWQKLEHLDRHLLRALAIEHGARVSPLFSHFTSATLHALPLLRFQNTHVHLYAPRASSTPRRQRRSLRDSRGSAATAVIRHSTSVPTKSVVSTDSLRHTDLVQTVLDVARVAPFAAGLVCADAALRRLARDDDMHDMDVESARALILARLEASPQASGADRARRVVRFASALAESPLESLTRLQLARLGYDLHEQIPVPGPEGQTYRMDFELLGHRCFIEADGKVKYTDERMLNGMTASERVFREKRRDNWVSGTTGKTVLHNGWPEAQSPHAMASMLRAFRLIPPNPDGLARVDLH